VSPHLAAVLQALFVVFLWATSWVFIKIGLQEISPLTFAGLRYFLAFACLLAVLLARGGREALRAVPHRAWLRLLLLGLLFYAGTQGASFVALAFLPAITVNLLWSFSSVAVAALGIAFLSEKPTLLQWTGILLASVGAMVYFSPVDIPRAQAIGYIVAVGGVMANAVSAILGREINRSGRYSPLVVTVISMGAGSVTLLSTGLAIEGLPKIGLQTWALIAWLAVVNTAFAFTLWNRVLRTLTAMESSVINGTMLVWIPLFAVLLLGEHLTAKGAAGLAAVGAGTVMVQLQRVKSQPPG
jgi:drug/metabolite transporter (DMT)-like permease